VISIAQETSRVRTIQFAVTSWPGHLAGQHVDVRLTAEDGYRAERSYSIASPPEAPGLALTVERLDQGEVSPYLTDNLQPGDTIELRGPIGGHFVWSAVPGQRPLLLIAGGSGVVPLMSMLRHRKISRLGVPAALVYSARTRESVIYLNELRHIADADQRFTLMITLTRDRAPDWPGGVGRIDLRLVASLVERLGGVADSFVCGPAGFVEFASGLLLKAGQPAEAIRTERFGPTGS
jgi:ferredoxin-NADP reductase